MCTISSISGKAYCYEEQETSTDSEEDVLRRLQQSVSFQSTHQIVNATRSNSTHSHLVSPANPGPSLSMIEPQINIRKKLFK